MANVAKILRDHALAKAQRVRRAHTSVETINEDTRSKREWAAFCHDLEMDSFNDIPDRLGKTGEHEPKSIYSPAPPSKFQRIAPRKRNAPDRSDTGEVIEVYRPPGDVRLPAVCSRRHRTMVLTRTVNVAWEVERRKS